MKKFTKLIVGIIVSQLLFFNVYAQINSEGVQNTGVPFGHNTSYDYGIMPTNLPTIGEYGRSQAAADAYNDWKATYVEQCGNGTYRVKFDVSSQTVSEGIAYGMLLSVYAGDKPVFDGCWQFFQNSMNNHGLMNWMTDGCNGNPRDNAATDADLDAALALIIADEQWPGGSYLNDAKTLINNIQQYEMDQGNYNTLNGDAWFNNNCLNPSYQSPAYYREYAKVDVADASFWNSAVTASYNLLDLNINQTTGLCSNWCDAAGNNNACAGTTPDEYGSDACRNPWRMATDVLWNGTSTAADGLAICNKLANFVNGYEGSLRGPMAQNASNPTQGSYKNGSYTTFALPAMAAGSSYQNSLNACYSNVAGLAADGAYFNTTIKTLTLFVLTGNFWKPGTSGVVKAPEVLSAVSNEAGTQISVIFTKDINSSIGAASNFTVAVNGANQGGAITNITYNSPNGLTLTVNGGVLAAGQDITLSYNGSSIQSTDGAALEAFSGQYVKNALAGNSIIVDDCEDGNGQNFMGGAWFTYNDNNDTGNGAGASVINPLSSEANPFVQTPGGADGTSMAAYITYTLGQGQNLYQPFVGLGCNLDPASTSTVPVEVDITGATGISFWHKGDPVIVQIETEITGGKGYASELPYSATWQHHSLDWSKFSQPSWVQPADAQALDLSRVRSIQWQIKGTNTGLSDPFNGVLVDGEMWIDEVVIEGKVPTAITDILVAPTAVTIDIDETIELETTFTPTTATYKELGWVSYDEGIATVNDTALVTGIAAGVVTIEATSKKDSDLRASCAVTVIGPEVLPTSISLNSTSEDITVGETFSFTATVLPSNTTDKTVTWSSSNTAIATVNSSGVVTGISIGGPVTITATSNALGSVVGTATVTVVKTDVTGLTVSTNTVNLTIGESETITYTIEPGDATNQDVTWTSGDDGIATVSQSGVISSQGVGTTTIRATSDDNASVYQDITVNVSAIPVTSVTVTPATLSLVIGQSSTLTKEVLPSGATQTVVWASSDTDVATVSGGLITTVGIGTATITATSTEDGTKVGSCALTVNPQLVTGIDVTPATSSLVIGQTVQLSATVSPSGATDKTYTWSSSNDAIATVSTSGLVSAKATGSVTIYATANDAGAVVGSSSITVSNQLVTGIVVTPATSSVIIGQTVQLAATVSPSNATDKTYTWSSGDDNIATVSATGLVTTKAVGTVNIIATANDLSGETGSCALTVEPRLVSSITLNKTTSTLDVGAFETLTATVSPTNATDGTYTWSSSNNAIATVSTLGLVNAVSEGSVTITATANDASGQSASCTYTISTVLPQSVTTAPSIGFLITDNAQILSATVQPTNTTDKSVSWSSSDITVATVDPSTGEVTPVGLGTCTITVTCDALPSVFAECAVTVDDVIINETGVTLNESSLTIPVGTSVTLTETVEPANATNKSVTWSTSDESIATVSNGVVDAKAIGTATITVTTVNLGFTASATITVSAIPVSTITLDQTSLSFSETSAPKTLSATVSPSTATNKLINWTSSNPAVVTVNDGVVSVVGLGSATITATAADLGGAYAECSVVVSETPVTGVSLNESTLSLAATSAPVTLVATVSPAGATNTLVTWESSDINVATVLNGVVSVVGVGNTTITVTTVDGGFAAECAVTVSAIQVTLIELDQTSLSLNTSSTPVTLHETITPATASDKTVIWASDNTDVATVAYGVVTVKGIGTAIITATANDGSNVSASCTVTVSATSVTGVTLDQATMSLTVGSSSKLLTATVLPTGATNKTVNWSTGNSAIATVNNSGVVSPVSEGNTTITVTTEDGNYFATCDVIVSPAVGTPVTGVTVSPVSISKQLGQAIAITAIVAPSNASNKAISWTSSDETVATVDGSGNVTSLKVGSTTITATTVDGGFSKNCAVTITPILATSVVINSNAISVGLGFSQQLTATVYPAGASQSVTWFSDNTSVATVDVNGNVSGVGQGTANITATTSDGTNLTSDDCIVTITVQAVTGVTVNPTSLIIDINGGTQTVTAVVAPASAYDKGVSWTVNNSNVTVLDGVVTPVSIGFSVLTVRTDESGYTAKCSVEVVDKTALAARITAVQAIHDAAVEGTELGNYKTGSKADLQTAIDAATVVSVGTTYTQIAIDAALASLNAAEIYFQKQLVTDETIVFDGEHGNKTLLKTFWFSFDDSEASDDPTKVGASIVTPKSTVDNEFTMSTPGADGSGSAAMIEYTLNKGGLEYDPFVGMGMALNTESDTLPYDLTGSTGIKFSYKASQTYYLEINLKDIKDDCNYYITFPASADWTTIQIGWDELSQYTWGVKVDWDLTQIVKFQWKVQTATGTTGQLWVDDVTIKGVQLDLPSLVEFGALEDLLATASALQTAAVEGTANGEYEVGSKAIFQTAIDAANAIFVNPASTQDQVDGAFDDLTAAIAVFQDALIGQIDKSALINKIFEAETIVKYANIGTKVGDYPQVALDAFQDAINAAILVKNSTTATPNDVTTAVTELQDAIAIFEATRLGSSVNRTSLETIIGTMTTYVNSVEKGLLGVYPQSAIEEFKAAIWDATNVYEDGTASQADVDQAYDDLNDAFGKFLETKGNVDPTALNGVDVIEIKVYPNPSSSIITVQAEGIISNIEIVSETGGVVIDTDVAEKSIQIDISNLAVGKYFVNVILEDGTAAQATIAKK